MIKIQFTGDLVFQISQDPILHSAEEENLPPFDSEIACLSQCTQLNNNKHEYRQMQKPTYSEVKRA